MRRKISNALTYFPVHSNQLDSVSLTGYSNATSLSWLDNLKAQRIVTTGGSADFDHDGDVDANDFSLFHACLAGSNQAALAVGCADKDLDEDLDVDQADFGLFQRCYSGEANPTDLDCAG